MIIFDKNKYKASLRRSVCRFAKHDFLYQEVSKDIADRLSEMSKNFDYILEIGSRGILHKLITHQKNYTHHNTEPKFLPANANNIISDNELLPLELGSFDLILSVLELHNTNDLPGVLVQILRSLKKDGLMIGAIFGGKTLQELRSSMIKSEIALDIPSVPHISPMADIQDLPPLMQRMGFKDVVVDSYVITVLYKDIISLMRDLRYMGQGNILVKRTGANISKKLLSKIEEIYKNNYACDNQLVASFEIITMTGLSNG
jgi:SAM-dependent methyltransferase